MAQLCLPHLSKYQLGVLCDTALGSIPIFLLPRPCIKDTVRQRKTLERQYEEVKSLLEQGLIEDVSHEFLTYIANHIKQTGRRFKVFGLSELGFCMFKDGLPTTVN